MSTIAWTTPSRLSHGLTKQPPSRRIATLDDFRTRIGGRLPRGWSPEAPGETYGRIGSLEVRRAGTRDEVRSAQRLRYEVFYEEMTARPTFMARMRRRDEDGYDAICDHLLVVDDEPERQAPGSRWRAHEQKVAGTYRVLRQDIARRTLGFYSQGEYDVAPLIARMPQRRFVELGRSCVLKPYRTKRTVELLWHGLWTYVRQHRADVMIGCASFPGADPAEHAAALSYLRHVALAPEEWRCRAHTDRYVPMDTVPLDRIDTKAVLKAMPPLLKAYMRLGAFVGDGAVADLRFGTTDVLVVLPVERIDARYLDRFGHPGESHCRVG